MSGAMVGEQGKESWTREKLKGEEREPPDPGRAAEEDWPGSPCLFWGHPRWVPTGTANKPVGYGQHPLGLAQCLIWWSRA